MIYKSGIPYKKKKYSTGNYYKKKKNNNLIFTLYFSIQIAFVTALVAAEKLQGSLTTLKTVVFFPVRTDLQKMLNLQLNESKMGH
jgi:ABC-type spermidine/putrescine transport system permease subunit II